MTEHNTETKNDATWNRHLASWGMYAAAAGASLSLAASAQAGIIHGTLNITATINPNSNASTLQRPDFAIGTAMEALDLQNRPASTMCSGLHGSPGCIAYGGGPGTMLPRMGDAALAPNLFDGQQVHFFTAGAGGDLAVRFNSGALIGGAHSNQSALLNGNGGFGDQGLFALNQTGFVGFKIVGGYLGWLRVDISDRNHDGYPDQVTLVDYAYNGVFGGAIDAGQTGSASPTPEPDTKALALLACGAAGIIEFRRRRKQMAA